MLPQADRRSPILTRPMTFPPEASVTVLRPLFLLPALLAASTALAELRCGGNLITKGDRAYDVLALCGEPDDREEIAGAYLPGIGVLVAEQRWYYNRGPRELLRVVRMREGRVESIDTAGYGFDDSIRGDCKPELLRTGMHRLELLARCGPPAYKEARLEVSPPVPTPHAYSRVIPVEEWTYDFGSGRFTRTVTLVEGEVRRVDSGRRR